MQEHLMAVSELLRQAAARWPGKEAVVDRDQRLRYEALNELVDRLAGGFIRYGIASGDRVGVMARNSLEQVATFLALNRIGAVTVTFNPQLTSGEMLPLCQLVQLKALMFDCDVAEQIAPLRDALSQDGSAPQWISIGGGVEFATSWESLSAEAGPQVGPLELPGSAPSLMMFTSGTTSLPKAVTIERRAEWINAIFMIAELGFKHEDRTLHIAPLFHIAPWHCYFVPHMAVGATNIIQRRYDPATLRQTVEQQAITNLLGVPTHFELASRLWSEDARPISGLRHVTVTGGPVRRGLLEWVRDHLCPEIWNIYGLTESTTLITICSPKEIWRSRVDPCIGRALLGMEVKLVPPGSGDATAEEVPPDVEGELICRGPKLMSGYFRNPQKTADALRGGWLFTGDVCYRDRDGLIYYKCRRDDAIVTGGEKVLPPEVESELNKCPLVADSVVLGMPDELWGARIEAFVVPVDSTVSPEAIDQWLRTNGMLASYKRPKKVHLIREIPRNPSGKVLRRVLVAKASERADAAPAQ